MTKLQTNRFHCLKVYIDFAAGCEAEYSESSEDESESQNSDEEDDDSVFERMRQIDSLSNGNIPFNEEGMHVL